MLASGLWAREPCPGPPQEGGVSHPLLAQGLWVVESRGVQPCCGEAGCHGYAPQEQSSLEMGASLPACGQRAECPQLPSPKLARGHQSQPHGEWEACSEPGTPRQLPWGQGHGAVLPQPTAALAPTPQPRRKSVLHHSRGGCRARAG